MIKKVVPIINKIQEKYKFLKLSEEYFYKIIDNNISEFSCSKNNSDLQKIEHIIEEDICMIINSRLKENADTLINDYIDYNIIISDDLRNNFSLLAKFVSFFEQFDYELQIFSVIISNSIMMELVKVINNDPKFNLEDVEENIACWLQIYNTIIKSEESLVEEEYFPIYNGKGDSTIKRYFLEMSRYPLLNSEQEKKLSYKMISGDREAKEKLINSNLRLVVSIAKRKVNKGLPFLDLIQEGNLGLIKAAENYNPSLGYKFSTFATCCIKQAISKAIYDKSTNIRIPVYLYGKINKYKAVKKIFMEENGYEPSVSEIALIMDLSVDEVNKIVSLQYNTLSLNKILKDEDNKRTELEDFVILSEDSLEDSVIQKLIYSDVVGLLDKSGLKEREKEILILFFGLYGNEAMTLTQIGNIYGITRERARQIKDDGLIKIRNTDYVRKNIDLYADGNLDSFDSLSYKKNRANKSLNTIFENYEDYTKEQIYIVLSCLKDRHKKLVVDRYGDDFDTPVCVSGIKKEDHRKFYRYLNSKIKNKLKLINTLSEKSISISDDELIQKLGLSDFSINIDSYVLLDLLRKITYYKMPEIYSHMGNAIVALKLGYIDGKCFSNSDIALFFDIKESLVIELLYKTLNIYCASAHEFINCNSEDFTNKIKLLNLKNNI